ncbi:MAG: glycosyltransferase family 2 protein, partial [Candidatus Bathyarchaeia archaeon]
MDELEIVVVDDASTDYTQMKMENISDLKLIYIRNDERIGSSK